VPALSLLAPRPRERHLRLVAVGLVALLLASVAVTWASPATARDWTPQIKTARGSQIYWEAAMRAADAEVRAVRVAKRQMKANLKRATSKLKLATERRSKARHALVDSRKALHSARIELPAGPVRPPASPDVVAAAMALRLAGLEDVDIGASDPTNVVFAEALETDETAVAAAIERGHRLLEKRVSKQQRHFRKTVRKAQRAARAVRISRARLSSLKARERGAITRRESAERSLGSWILTMERYARGRAANMAKYRPGIDSPFAWPARGRISQSYSRSHDGLDIVSYQGTPIRAAAFGVVSYIGWNPWDEHGRAFMVVVAHVGGLETLYGHILPRRSVRIGQAVKQGEVIGYMGKTGNSTGTHVHFEVRRGRTTMNPLGFL